MKLFEHPDFEQAILQAERHFKNVGLRAAIIEKDYYVTEALRLVSALGDKVIFKGGTSLSKGWNLINRFSEDIDIFYATDLSGRPLDRELKDLREIVAEHPALTHLPDESQTIGGFGRNDRFEYRQIFGGAGEVANRVLLEAGTASGRQPTEIRELRSFLAQFLQETGVSLGAEDESAFPMRLLHFRRTFVEKLFAIHGKIELMKSRGQLLGSYARHYYDLYQLSQRPEVTAMLAAPEYAEIKEDYDRISREHFAKSYFFPEGMSFAKSEAFFPSVTLAATIEKEYEAQCKLLCYGAYPSWADVQTRFEELKPKL